ncbi:MAG: hypothetical protein WA148_06840 [Actinomycetota bacterium]
MSCGPSFKQEPSLVRGEQPVDGRGAHRKELVLDLALDCDLLKLLQLREKLWQDRLQAFAADHVLRLPRSSLMAG